MTESLPQVVDLASKQTSDRRLITAGILLGIGGAGFFDGIVLHQVLQWHHMLTSVRPLTNLADVELNTLWDGLFHLSAFGFTVAGLVLLWGAIQRDGLPASSRSFIGALLIGAGGFNLVEGVIDHHILQIHHVKPGPYQLAWDLGFLAIGALLAAIGWFVLNAASREDTSTRT